ncbi:hypothetical protein F4V91_03145 [Neorhizobium galegae]|uniref:Tripartite tricarboxylate transporter substrate binding protein n=1 Tax=Neorhizobium galegae TaxID=399 RepID=A0A6A1TMJ3_NEOGA|nr:hypothetical protein F4V91_03145 [Neorhizobium galegae]
MKKFLAGALALVFSAYVPGGTATAADDNYPSRQITLLAGFPAGSGADVYARFFAKKLEEQLKQTVIVDNKPGGLGSLSVVALKNAKPDGYTMLIGSADQFTAAPYVFNAPPYDPLKDFDYVAPVFSQAFMMLVNAKSPYQKISDLTKAMKEKGAKGSYATSNFPSVILAEMYKANTGVPDTLRCVTRPVPTRSTTLQAAPSTTWSATRSSALPARVTERCGCWLSARRSAFPPSRISRLSRKKACRMSTYASGGFSPRPRARRRIFSTRCTR